MVSQLQFKALQNSPRPYSTFGIGSSVKCRKISQLKFGQPLISWTVTVNPTKIGQSFSPLNGTNDGLRCAVVVPSFARCGFCRSLASLNNFCSTYVEKGNCRILTNDGIFPKRYFSNARRVASKNDTVNTPDGKHGKSTFGFWNSNKHKKRAKAFVVHGKDRDVISSTSASKDVDIVTSRKSLVDHKGSSTSTPPLNNNKQDSKLTGRKKKKSESKKNKNSVSSSSEVVAGTQVSINSSEASASDISDIGLSSSDLLKVSEL